MPPPSAFRTSVVSWDLDNPPPPQPSVVGTAVSGKTVVLTVLTLDHAVQSGDRMDVPDVRMDVRYGTCVVVRNGHFECTVPESNPIRNRDGNAAKAFGYISHDVIDVQVLPSGESGPGGQSGGESASVTGVSIVSDPGADKTYMQGDKIRIVATRTG